MVSISVCTDTVSDLPSTRFGAVPQIFWVGTDESKVRVPDATVKSRPEVAERVTVW